MPLFRRKTTIIKAEQYLFSSTQKPDGVCSCTQSAYDHVHTIHNGQLVVLADGDWVLPEPDEVRHYYPVRADVFAATYEPV